MMNSAALGLGMAVRTNATAAEHPIGIYLDHVALAVRDLDAARLYLFERFGLDTVEGGDHPEWGTGNRIVPLGKHFIEVVGVVDPTVAATSPVGQIIQRQAAAGDRIVGVCVGATDRAAATAHSHLQWVEGSRDGHDGQRLTFRSAGLPLAIQSGDGFPYFFEYDDPRARLGRGTPHHRSPARRIARVHLQQDVARVRDYLGEVPPEFDLTDGEPRVLSIDIETDAGLITLPGRLA